MAHLLTAKDELSGFHDLLKLVLVEGTPSGNYLEILACLLTFPFQLSRWKEFCSFKDTYLRIGGEVARIGWERATRVYTCEKDRPTKPSYLKRLIAYPDRPRRFDGGSSGLNQLDKICTELAKKPGFSNLSFVFLRPADLHDQFRPGYVPCVIAGDFKFRAGQLDMSAMLRTNDAFAVAYADIYYLRLLQQHVLLESQKRTKHVNLKEGGVGNLNLYFSRVYIERNRAIRKSEGHSKQVKIMPLAEALISELETQKLTEAK